jgi:hypothetical protein
MLGLTRGEEYIFVLNRSQNRNSVQLRYRHKYQEVVMNIYPDRGEIQGWIEWTRRNLPYEGDIPCLDWTGPEVKAAQSDDMPSEAKNAGTEEPPWSERITELLDEAALYENWKAPSPDNSRFSRQEKPPVL